MVQKKRKVSRVVLDTNIFVSALLFNGEASRLVELWKNGEILPLVSEDTFKEIISVLAYPGFELEKEEITSIVNNEILPYIEAVKITRRIEGICPDGRYDMFLACAVNGQAEAIISGDKHLTGLKEFEGIPILRIRDLIDVIS